MAAIAGKDLLEAMYYMWEVFDVHRYKDVVEEKTMFFSSKFFNLGLFIWLNSRVTFVSLNLCEVLIILEGKKKFE